MVAQSNIIEGAPQMPLMRSLKSLMFCAHDEQEHAIVWSNHSNSWRIENKNGLYIEYAVLHRAWGDMYAITGIDAGDWTVTDNPYTGG